METHEKIPILDIDCWCLFNRHWCIAAHGGRYRDQYNYRQCDRDFVLPDIRRSAHFR
jgi:hypothetical protein